MIQELNIAEIAEVDGAGKESEVFQDAAAGASVGAAVGSLLAGPFGAAVGAIAGGVSAAILSSTSDDSDS